jgi:hypothetical protein
MNADFDSHREARFGVGSVRKTLSCSVDEVGEFEIATPASATISVHRRSSAVLIFGLPTV